MNQREWWKESGSLVRPKPAARITCARPGDSILIVTEGTVTEPVYFQLLREDIKLTAVTVHIEPGDASHPRHVIETAARLAKEQSRRARKRQLAPNEPSKYDHVWAVIDTDVAVREGVWSDMRQLADARKIKLAHSTPCFETWLLFHFGRTTRADLPDGKAAKTALKKELGRDYATDKKTANAVMPAFIAKWPLAVQAAEFARRHHAASNTPAPANPSTEVDRLVLTMNDSTHPASRKIP